MREPKVKEGKAKKVKNNIDEVEGDFLALNF